MEIFAPRPRIFAPCSSSRPVGSCRHLCLSPASVKGNLASRRPRRGAVRVVAAAATPAVKVEGLDEEKEQALTYRRIEYDSDAWRTHRSIDRYRRHMATMLTSRIVRGLRYPLLAEALMGVLVVVYDAAYKAGDLPEVLPPIDGGLALPLTLTSFALSLLLAHRTRCSYGRFTEARGFWAHITSRCRDIVRQSLACMDDATEADRQALVGRWVTAFAWSMVGHCRWGDRNLETDVRRVGGLETAYGGKGAMLTDQEADLLLKSPHRPHMCMQVLAEAVWGSDRMLPQQQMCMDQNLTHLADMVGACERIMRTPVPVSYTRHTSRFLVLWLAFLPASILASVGPLLTVPTSVLIAFFLLAIEDIGVQIEEPFSVLPLEALAQAVEDDVRGLLQLGPDMEAGLTGSSSPRHTNGLPKIEA